MIRLLFLAILLNVTKSSAEELFVFSEVPLLVAGGRDRISCESAAALPSEALLSPAVEQGGKLTLLLLVSGGPGRSFLLETGQFPKEAFSLRMHRLFPHADPATEPVTVPLSLRGRIPQGQRCALFLLEVDVPETYPVSRTKLEPAVWFPNPRGENFWVRAPLEVRVVPRSGQQQVFPRECLNQLPKLRRILMHAVPPSLDVCIADSGLVPLAEQLKEFRRNLGKNQ